MTADNGVPPRRSSLCLAGSKNGVEGAPQGVARQDLAFDLESGFFGGPPHGSMAVCKAIFEPEHPLSITRQCALLGLSRSSVYYRPVPAPAEDLVIMRRLDELQLEHPWMGSRSLRDQLQRDGHPVGRNRVRRLMQRMGLHAVYGRPRTTIPDQTHRISPCRLRGPRSDRSNQVWAADVTYFPMARGSLCLVAILD